MTTRRQEAITVAVVNNKGGGFSAKKGFCQSCRWWVRIESTPMGECRLNPIVMVSTGGRATCEQFERPARPRARVVIGRPSIGEHDDADV
jgi:hypothetical protein